MFGTNSELEVRNSVICLDVSKESTLHGCKK